MRFTVNDKTYFVKWEYPDITKNIPVHTFTVCKIYDTTTSYSEPLVETRARLAEGDKFCKNTGRKISLDRALHKLFPYHTGYKVRATAWAEYFKESPKRLK